MAFFTVLALCIPVKKIANERQFWYNELWFFMLSHKYIDPQPEDILQETVGCGHHGKESADK